MLLGLVVALSCAQAEPTLSAHLPHDFGTDLLAAAEPKVTSGVEYQPTWFSVEVHSAASSDEQDVVLTVTLPSKPREKRKPKPIVLRARQPKPGELELTPFWVYVPPDTCGDVVFTVQLGELAARKTLKVVCE